MRGCTRSPRARTAPPAAGTHGASTRAWRALAGSSRNRSLRRRGLVIAFPAIVAGLNRAGLGPFHTDISTPELRRAGLRALGIALDRLGVRAPHVIFGHTHRAGPLGDDDRFEWHAPAGRGPGQQRMLGL